MLFFPHCQEFAGKKKKTGQTHERDSFAFGHVAHSAQGSSQAWIQMAPVALWDLNTVLFPPVGAGGFHANAESAQQKFSHYFW